LPGHHPSHDFILELEAAAPGKRFKTDPDVPVLAPAPGLFLVLTLYLHLFPDGLLIRDLWRLEGHLHAELPFQGGKDDLHMHLTHDRGDQLQGLFMAMDPQSRLLLADPMDGIAQFIFIPFGLGFNGIGDDRFREN